jgi:riboflavin synthase
MFTGIVSHIGTVERIEKSGDWRFTIAASGITKGMETGASIACSGVCLTVIRKDSKRFAVQASQETLACTTLGQWETGTHVNLERSLKVGDELGGHFVSGHVDTVATLAEVARIGESREMWFALGTEELCAFIAPKGSVTLDGVSLTVNKVEDTHFSVNIIPHTLHASTLGERKNGDMLNVEVDIIARYLARFKTYSESR